MRIVAGSAKGRALAGPKATSKHIRPTADRVRETLFNVLGQWLEGQRVLDLYAGTGALGLEAVSRGAKGVVLVDSDREALALCRANTDTLGFSARVEVLAQPVARALETLGRRGDRFQLIFADPPYAARVVETVLEGLSAHQLLADGGTVVIEHDKREPAPEAHAGFTRVDQRRFGDTLVSLFRIA
ncbi:16S rRNA (guanine(966)-N(2))-methyltransferase RsmD [Cystobacter fuscus]|uniref:16S rRNA (guanine(966)-N(2))-methyltransferase RsmD n=1 Tax=Cystobacter fuscus TaxID=43 RepID=UPI002B30E189|nr:16S rRNA (guanine(966)-N(2))-methyltransferase RsmD [Cystobacter fuscus]